MLNRRQLVGLFIGSMLVGLCPDLSLPAENESSAVAAKSKSRPACILIWLEGGPPTIDMWDLKRISPGTSSRFKAIATAGNMEICEHFPKIAKVMNRLSIIRSMTSRGEVGERGRAYMHTSFVPNPNIDHPAVGSVIGRELSLKRLDLNLPAYVSLNGTNSSAGYLEQQYAPLVVDDPRDFLRHADLALTEKLFEQPTDLLDAIDSHFGSDRTRHATEYRGAKQQAIGLLCSNQLQAFNVDDERPALRAAYGMNEFGENLLVARRLVEEGVPFVEVTLPGWDTRHDYFKVLREDLFPKLDAGLSTLVHDLQARRLFDDTVVIVTGGFARSPRIRNERRDHWSRSWSLIVGGGGLKGGIVVGQTTESGRVVQTKIHHPPDLWATVGSTLGISLDTIYTSRRGRPVKIFNGGTPIEALLEP